MSEWCLDPFLPHYLTAPLAPLDGLARGDGFGHRSIRGGDYGSRPAIARSAFRTDRLEDFRSSDVGLRAARPLAGYRDAVTAAGAGSGTLVQR